MFSLQQRIAMCTREGRNPSINLEHYQGALKYPEWRKICVEFDKRVDPQLLFYYYTYDHDH